MSECRKCGATLAWQRRQFKGVWKWVPTNPDGSDHWDLCRERLSGKMSPEKLAQRRVNDEKRWPPFWTVPDGRGSYRTVYQMPKHFGQQPDGELLCFDHDGADQLEDLDPVAADHMRSLQVQ